MDHKIALNDKLLQLGNEAIISAIYCGTTLKDATVASGTIIDDRSTIGEIGSDWNGVKVECGYLDLLTDTFPMPSISGAAEIATFLKPRKQKRPTPVVGDVQ